MSNEIPKTTTVTLNPENFEDAEGFEQSRLDAIAAQRNGEDPDFEGVLSAADYAGDVSAYDAVTNKWLAQEMNEADAGLAEAKARLNRSLGHSAEAALTYRVEIDEAGAVTGIMKAETVPQTRQSPKGDMYKTINAGRMPANTPKYRLDAKHPRS